jgi:hypothetical protein
MEVKQCTRAVDSAVRSERVLATYYVSKHVGMQALSNASALRTLYASLCMNVMLK